MSTVHEHLEAVRKLQDLAEDDHPEGSRTVSATLALDLVRRASEIGQRGYPLDSTPGERRRRFWQGAGSGWAPRRG